MKVADAVRYFGSVQALADELGISPQAVYKWESEVPPLRAYELEELTDGELSR